MGMKSTKKRIKVCPKCQFEESKFGTYEYTPHAPGCSRAKVTPPKK